MTLNEFKAWLKGFEGAIDGSPNAKQWGKIREKLDQVKPGVREVSVTRKEYAPQPWWGGPVTFGPAFNHGTLQQRGDTVTNKLEGVGRMKGLTQDAADVGASPKATLMGKGRQDAEELKA